MIEKRMKHDEIIELILEEFKNDFDVYANISGWSHYRGSRVSCKADVLLYDPVNGFLFGVEVKTFYSFNTEWMKKTFEQMVGYNNAGFKIPNLNRPLHPHGFFLASPRTNEKELLSDPQLMKHLELLPGGLGILRIKRFPSQPLQDTSTKEDRVSNAMEALERLRTSNIFDRAT